MPKKATDSFGQCVENSDVHLHEQVIALLEVLKATDSFGQCVENSDVHLHEQVIALLEVL